MDTLVLIHTLAPHNAMPDIRFIASRKSFEAKVWMIGGQVRARLIVNLIR